MIRIEHVGPVPLRHSRLGTATERNGTELRLDGDVSVCEHLCLITREKSLLNGDVPRRNGNVTYNVNRPLLQQTRLNR